jgi:branched-chain amino acid transport system ATP-binding protein
VPEGRMVFPSLSVEENLRMGAETGRPGPWSLARVQALFPLLRERRLHRPDSLSGGQQQMLAIGRALMSNPRLLLCDELSLGLAPIVVEDIYRALAQIRGEGMSVLLVEQDVQRACRAAERVVCLLKGRVTLQARSAELDRDALVQAYFG